MWNSFLLLGSVIQGALHLFHLLGIIKPPQRKPKPLPSKNKPFLSKLKPLPNKNNPLLSKNKPFLRKFKPLPSKNTPHPSKNKPKPFPLSLKFF